MKGQKVVAMTEATLDGKIVLQNADCNPLHSITLQKAARLLALEKAVIVEGDPLRKFGEWIWPKILRLTNFVYIPWKNLNGPLRVSRKGVLIRDNRICGYCRAPATTIDHVKPRSQGGKNLWENLVSACLKCNHRKRNRTPEEAGMKLLWKPYAPDRSTVGLRS